MNIADLTTRQLEILQVERKVLQTDELLLDLRRAILSIEHKQRRRIAEIARQKALHEVQIAKV